MPTAPLPVLPGVYYGRVQGTADLRTISNIFSFRQAGRVLNDPIDAANANAVALSLASRWPAFATAVLHTVYTGVRTQVYPLGSVLLPAATHILVAPGGVTGAQHFKQIAVRISHAVPRRGRGAQHSSAISPISRDLITINGDQITAPFVTTVQNAFDTFIANCLSDLVATTGGVWSYVQVSKFQNKVYSGASYPIATSTVKAVLGSERSRLFG